MYDINFLTPEYKEKLKRSNLIRRCGVVFGSIAVAQLIIFTGLFIWNNNIENDLERERQEIASKEQRIAQIKKDMAEIPDLTDKIMVIEDLFKNENFRISEVIQSLEKNTPANLWFNTMNYDNGKISLNGVSYQNWELGMTSEENLYHFEKTLIESDLYRKVHHEMTNSAERNTHKISNFKFQLEMKE